LIDDIRRDNIALLVQEYGSLVALANRLERDSSQVSQWLNGSKNSGTGKKRGMRSDSARYIEEKCGKPTGWLDVAHNGVKAAVFEPASTVTSDEQWLLEKWRDAREEVQEVARFVLSRAAPHPPGWVDSDARAYVDSLQSKVRDWQGTSKSRNARNNEREKPVRQTTERSIERQSEQKFLQTRAASSA